MILVETVKSLRAFLPAKDFGASCEFYRALGFTEAWRRDKLAMFELGQFTFFLQDFYVKEWAENMMMDLAVADVDAYYSYLQGLTLVERFPKQVRINAPADDGTGVRRGHFVDPSGVLWHFSQPIQSK